ncbi:hypothetical protein TraAM80_07379 [Trypanosoma rangeli]|uniref:Uncharacterized protein n=1 Tax=Trypanosoma rangeli TaxID=5698 RepID=A0A422N5S1_TRYRA|nr:uncharacterized protein TraAM80_07379 [Trypanosoma rangeli]RNF00827.1 hypothetical protein TraAM80_07379 [Trypanosoma rangeli]|eukprot:RNF00827.1 hypothetical protein TraAM80_07379 [Trypanosoma rangeli]
MSPLSLLYFLASDMRAAGEMLLVADDGGSYMRSIKRSGTVVEHGMSGGVESLHWSNVIRGFVAELVEVRSLWEELGCNDKVIRDGDKNRFDRGCWWKYIKMKELRKDAEEYGKTSTAGVEDVLKNIACEMHALRCLCEHLVTIKLGRGQSPLRWPGSEFACVTGRWLLSPSLGSAKMLDAVEAVSSNSLLQALQSEVRDSHSSEPNSLEKVTQPVSPARQPLCVSAPVDSRDDGHDTALRSLTPASAAPARVTAEPRATMSPASALTLETNSGGKLESVLFLRRAPRREKSKQNDDVVTLQQLVAKQNELEKMVKVFLERENSWTDFDVKLERKDVNGSISPMWFAEGHVTLETGERATIVRTTHSRSRQATRIAMAAVAREHFPKELEYYVSIHPLEFSSVDLSTLSCDSDHKSEEAVCAGTSMLTKVLRLLEASSPSQVPISWVLEVYEATGGHCNGEEEKSQLTPLRYRAALMSKSKTVIGERIGSEGEGAVVVLCSVLRAATNRFAGDKGEQLWTEYECHAPPPVSTLRELALYMFNAFFGDGSSKDCLQVDADCVSKDMWKGTAKLRVLGRLVPIAEAYAVSKMHAIEDAALLSCRENFPYALSCTSLHAETRLGSVLVNVAQEVVREPHFVTVASLQEKQKVVDITRNAADSAFDRLEAAVRRKFYGNLLVEAKYTEKEGLCVCELILLSKENKDAMPEILGHADAFSDAEARELASIDALKSQYPREYEELISAGTSL